MAIACCCLQADIYSLGVLLWEIVTLDVPERGRMRPIKVTPLHLYTAFQCCSPIDHPCVFWCQRCLEHDPELTDWA